MKSDFLEELRTRQSELQQNLTDRDVSDFVLDNIKALFSSADLHDLCPEARDIVNRFLRFDHYMNRDAAATLLYWLDSRDGLSALGRVDSGGVPSPTVVGAATLSWIDTQAAHEILLAASLNPTFSGFVAACAMDLNTRGNGYEILFWKMHPTCDISTVAGGSQESAISRTKSYLEDSKIEVQRSYGTLRRKYGV